MPILSIGLYHCEQLPFSETRRFDDRNDGKGEDREVDKVV